MVGREIWCFSSFACDDDDDGNRTSMGTTAPIREVGARSWVGWPIAADMATLIG